MSLDTCPFRSLSPSVKRERSPSPICAERRLITSGTRRYAPVPDDCLSSCSRYKQNRSEWVAKCVKELEALNLIPERKFIRDDGLVVDWRSHVPVWSDTLKPDLLDIAGPVLLAHRCNAQWHPGSFQSCHAVQSESLLGSAATQECPTLSGTQPPLKDELPALPRPSLKRRNNPSSPISTDKYSRRLRYHDEMEPGNRILSFTDSMSIPSSQRNQLSLSRGPSNGAQSQLTATSTSIVAEETMSKITLGYVNRYVQTYETDRASLASAYSRNASFAYRVHQITDSPQCFSSGVKRARLDIVTTLLTLPCIHSNAQRRDTAQVEYDMFYLGGELGMFVVCRVVLHGKTVVHNFILRRKEADVEDAATEGVWPLTATAHQILVFVT